MRSKPTQISPQQNEVEEAMDEGNAEAENTVSKTTSPQNSALNAHKRDQNRKPARTLKYHG